MGRAFLGGALVLAIACGDAFTQANDTPAATGGAGAGMSGPTSSTGVGASSGCGDAVEVPAIPEGWESDYLIFSKHPDDNIACPGAGPFVGMRNLQVSDSCDCGCTYRPNDCEASATSFTDASCDNSAGSTIEIATMCTPVQAAYSGARAEITVDAATACGMAPAVEPPRYDTVVSCGVQPEGACFQRPEAPFERQICIWRPGQHDCPTSFPSVYSVFTDIDDQRTCSDCACTAGQGACEGTVAFYAGDACVGTPADEVPTGSCEELPESAKVYQYTPSENADCTQTSGSAQGTATERGWETICCTAQ